MVSSTGISTAQTSERSSDCVVALENVRFGWHPREAPILSIDSLRIERAERLLLRGPSGAGKSTLLSLIAGITIAREGSVRVLGQDLKTLSGAARDHFRADHIGVVFQSFNLIPYLSVLANTCLPCEFSRARRRRCEQMGLRPEEAARKLLDELDMGGARILHRPVTELSVGQQQRVAAARALIGQPELIIADEPTSALDTDRRAAFLELLSRECMRARTTLVFVSHDATLMPYFDRCVEFDDINRSATSKS
jgi:putative ABC transport system ATP-binding protein